MYREAGHGKSVCVSMARRGREVVCKERHDGGEKGCVCVEKNMVGRERKAMWVCKEKHGREGERQCVCRKRHGKERERQCVCVERSKVRERGNVCVWREAR